MLHARTKPAFLIDFCSSLLDQLLEIEPRYEKVRNSVRQGLSPSGCSQGVHTACPSKRADARIAQSYTRS